MVNDLMRRRGFLKLGSDFAVPFDRNREMLRFYHDRLTAATGWQPEIPLRRTMMDTIDWWERELESGSP